MKKITKKTISALLALALVVTSLTFMAAPRAAKAEGIAGVGYISKANNTIVYYKDAPFKNGAYFRANGKIPKDAKITSIKSSKKSVAGIVAYKEERLFFVDAKKAGNIKVTVRAKKGSKKYKAVYAFKIINYKNPASSIKFGKKNLTKKFNTAKHYMEYVYNEKRKSFKIDVTPKRGFKVKKIEYFYIVNDERKDRVKTIKNHSTLKRVPGATSEMVWITYSYMADKRTSSFCVASNWKKESLGIERAKMYFRE